MPFSYFSNSPSGGPPGWVLVVYFQDFPKKILFVLKVLLEEQ